MSLEINLKTDDAFLVIDLNSNGMIDDGTELFGDNTLIITENKNSIDGCDALAQYDSNQDGKITKKDNLWNRLILWNDSNGTGTSDVDEISFVHDSTLEGNSDVNGSLLQDWSWVKTNRSSDIRRVKMVDVYFSPINN